MKLQRRGQEFEKNQQFGNQRNQGITFTKNKAIKGSIKYYCEALWLSSMVNRTEVILWCDKR